MKDEENLEHTDTSFIGIDDTELFVYFHGGKDEPSSLALLYKYISKNLIYPDSARKMGIEGTVYVSFSINEIGKISDINIDKGLCPEIDHEVIKLVSNMPDWNWDKRIKPKSRQYKKRLPIRFKLD
ncbi:MAG: energy transducer TonB [Bacteroidota bacterium]